MGRSKRTFTEEEIFKMKKLFSEGVNIEEIAKRLHTSKKNITPICGVRKQPRPAKIKKFNGDIEKIKRQHFEQGKTFAEIAKKEKIKPQTMKYWIFKGTEKEIQPKLEDKKYFNLICLREHFEDLIKKLKVNEIVNIEYKVNLNNWGEIKFAHNIKVTHGKVIQKLPNMIVIQDNMHPYKRQAVTLEELICREIIIKRSGQNESCTAESFN